MPQQVFLFIVGTFKLRANIDAKLVYKTLDHALKTGYRLIGRGYPQSVFTCSMSAIKEPE